MALIYYIPFYMLIVLSTLYGIVSIILPRWIARWDFHYNERDNPSSLYLLKCRIRGIIIILFITCLLVSLYIISRR